MRRRATALAAAAGALAAGLAGCPLPQPLAEVARTVDGGTISTPIVLPETAVPPDTTVRVSATCAVAPQFSMTATVEDLDTTDGVEARWFVDYRLAGDVPVGFVASTSVPASGDASDPLRAIPPFVFKPYDFGRNVPLHVVEVVVSNNFLPLSDPTPPKQRAAPTPFQTQVYRWVFQFDDAAPCP